MVMTHIEFASDIAGAPCPDCARNTVREALLVTRHGLILARGASCVWCGHERHRASREERVASVDNLPRMRVAGVA
jgi:Zn ribbon nucleic-acid-binding protein